MTAGFDAQGRRTITYADLDAERIRGIILEAAPRPGDEFCTDQIWEPLGLVVEQHRRLLGRYLRYGRTGLPCRWRYYTFGRGSCWVRV